MNIFERFAIYISGLISVMLVMLIGVPVMMDGHHAMNLDTVDRATNWLNGEGYIVLADASEPLSEDLYARNIWPALDDTYNLGSADRSWNNGYFKDLYIDGTLSGGNTVRSATAVVAASNSATLSKAQADYVCDGTADNVEIQAAIDSLPSGGGRVILLEGTYKIATRILLDSGDDDVTIEGQRLSTILETVGDVNGVFHLTGVSRCVVRAMYINADTQTTAAQTHRIISTDTVENCTIEDCFLKEGSYYGISLHDANWCRIQNNRIWNCGDDGIHPASDQASYGFGNRIIGNIAHGNTFGIKDNGNTAGSYGLGTIINGNTCYDNSEYGIAVYDQMYGEITENVCYENGKSGIVLQASSQAIKKMIVMGNNCFNNSNAVAWGDGIVLVNADESVIKGNVCGDYQGTQTQRYGISLDADSANNIVQGNNVKDNVTAGALNSGSNNIIRDNEGYVTENSGSDSIASGTTSKSFTHGLATTPTIITYAWKEDPTNAPGDHWATGNTTHITVNVTSDPGASNLDFFWDAKVR